MGELKLHRRDGQQVRALLESGEFSHIETAAEELTDEFLLFAISSGLLAQWATTFPDPRAAAQIPMPVLLAASLAARFAKVYSLRKSGYVLRSARVLGALGYSVEEVESGAGISDRGTEEEAICSADVLRKLLVQLERQVTIAETPPTAVPAPEVEGAAAQVKVRQRLSRRAVKQPINEQESAARARAAAAELVGWYNRVVGPSLLEACGAGTRPSPPPFGYYRD